MGNYNAYSTFVGMDVHARSIDAKGVCVKTGEHFSHKFTSCPAPGEVAEWLLTLPQPVYCAYESGCTGFHLARELRRHGIDCNVIAVSTLPRSTKDRQHKCDKLDAKAIMREIANPAPEYSTVWIPSEETEAARDLVRAHQVAVDNTKRARQRLAMFLQRHGYVWNERTKGGNLRKTDTRLYEKWLDSITFNERAAQVVFEAYRRQIRDAVAEAKTLEEEVERIALCDENKPYVLALMQLFGISIQTAMLLRAEFGCFSRFKSGRQVSCWTGSIPCESSSGEKEVHGRITKAGDKYVRRALVEGVGGISIWKCRRKKTAYAQGVSATVKAIAEAGNVRLSKRFDYLTKRGLHHNKAKVAIVNELVRWVWVIGLQVELELQVA